LAHELPPAIGPAAALSSATIASMLPPSFSTMADGQLDAPATMLVGDPGLCGFSAPSAPCTNAPR